MPHGNRKADGQGRRAQVVLSAFIGGSKDAQDQLEGEEELDGHRLPRCRLVVQLEGEEKWVSGTGKFGDWIGNVEGEPRSGGTKETRTVLTRI